MGKAATFRYINMEGDNLSPREIAKNADIALDIARGVHGICELALATRRGEVDYDDETLFRVIHAAMEKAVEIGNHLFYDWKASEVEGEVQS